MVYRCEEKETQKAFALKVLKKTVRDAGSGIISSPHTFVLSLPVKLDLLMLPWKHFNANLLLLFWDFPSDRQKDRSYRNRRAAASLPPQHREYVVSKRGVCVRVTSASRSSTDSAEGDLRDGHRHRSGAGAGHGRRTVRQVRWNVLEQIRPAGTRSYQELRTLMLFVSRIVERGYYSERDAAHVIKQILEAVAVMSFLQFPSVL